MRQAALLFLMPSALLLAGSPGIRPRADANSYPAHQQQPDYAVGAVLIPPDQAKKMFKLDMNHAGYLVVEVGIYPAPGKDVDLYPSDFTLSAGTSLTAIRPVSADTVADVVAGKQDPPRARTPGDINTSVGASVGHVSYPDPVTGRRTSGTVTETNAGVGVGGPAPMPCRGYDCDNYPQYPAPNPQPSSGQYSNTVSQDLWEKGLPDGKTPRAVAGYLYFPKPSKKIKDAALELHYENADTKVRLPLPK
jgi:hypothetical protein